MTRLAPFLWHTLLAPEFSQLKVLHLFSPTKEVNNLATGKTLNNQNDPQVKQTNLGSKFFITKGVHKQTDKQLPGVWLKGFSCQVETELDLQWFFQPWESMNLCSSQVLHKKPRGEARTTTSFLGDPNQEPLWIRTHHKHLMVVSLDPWFKTKT